LQKSYLFSDDVFTGVRAAQTVTHMTSDSVVVVNHNHPTIQSAPNGQNEAPSFLVQEAVSV